MTRMRLGASGSNQHISITQSDGTTNIVVNQTAGTTTVTPPSGVARTFNDPFNGLVYVDGTLFDLGGNSSFSSSIQGDMQMTIAADQNIFIDNHIRYQNDPRSNPNAKNLLGIFSGRGHTLVDNDAPSNMFIDAILMASSSGRGVGVRDFSTIPPRGDLNLYGGMIMDSYQAIGTFSSSGAQVSGYRKQFAYDRRLLNRSIAPPFFPAVQPYAGRLRSILRTDWAQVVPDFPDE